MWNLDTFNFSTTCQTFFCKTPCCKCGIILLIDLSQCVQVSLLLSRLGTSSEKKTGLSGNISHTILKKFRFGTSSEKNGISSKKFPNWGRGGLPTWELFPHNTVFFLKTSLIGVNKKANSHWLHSFDFSLLFIIKCFLKELGS